MLIMSKIENCKPLKSFVTLCSNISSAGDYGRKKLRECDGLVDSLVYLVKKAIEKANIDNKSVENCVCVLRNLSYRAQEVEDPNYDKKQLPTTETRAGAKMTSDNLGCFNANKQKRKESGAGSPKETPTTSSRVPRTATGKGMDLLWQPEVTKDSMFRPGPVRPFQIHIFIITAKFDHK